MSEFYFISYSSVDGKQFALKLADKLAAGPPEISVWLDKHALRPGEDWDEQVVEAIRTCKGMLFIMSADSVRADSVCKNEWVRALKYKKSVIPLLLDRNAELPFRLGSRQYINFSDSFEVGLAQLLKHLAWVDSPEGLLQALKHRLSDAQRDLPRAEADHKARIQEDISELEEQITQQHAIVANPEAAEQRVQQTIVRGLERIREPAKAVSGVTRSKFVNPPPLVAPTWFQDRHDETKVIVDFLKDDALRLMTVVGRGGIGKSAMVCRLLRSVEGGQLPEDGGGFFVDGIVYLSNARAFHRVNFPDLYTGLIGLLPEEMQRRLDAVYKNPQTKTRDTLQALLDAFPRGRTVVLLDNFEDAINVETGGLKEADLDEALRALLELPPHGVKVIITTRVPPRDLALVEPGRQRRFDLGTGLETPYAENILRAMDVDGKVGLRDAPVALLTQARERTRGYPRALEHLFGILSADRDTSLQEILDNTHQLLPDKVAAVLVGEAFSRLDLTAQRVMEAMAVYRYPVPSAAVDYLLLPYLPGVDSRSVLKRLVNMQFAQRDGDRYYAHQIDRDYALSRIDKGNINHPDAEKQLFTRVALQNRAAEWFKLSRTARECWNTLDDAAPELAEFELRCASEDYNTAAAVLLEINDYLLLWGHYRMMVDLHDRLQGKISNPTFQRKSLEQLGSACLCMGQFERAVNCYSEAMQLAQVHNDRKAEGVLTGNLGVCYDQLGRTARAIDYHHRALTFSGEVGDRSDEASHLGNLGNAYSDLGQIARAIEYHQNALAIHREIHDRSGEATALSNLGYVLIDLGDTTKALKCLEAAITTARDIRYHLLESATEAHLGNVYLTLGEWGKAAELFKAAMQHADDSNTQCQQYALRGLALANLYKGEVAAAREVIERAKSYNFPLDNHEASVIFGVVAIRQGDFDNAREAFNMALQQADELLADNDPIYAALDTKGIALCGLALVDSSVQIRAAKEAYKAARAICSHAGIVARVLQLFDALAKADTIGILAEVRAVAAGSKPK
jgi:tetratricopeptide (TPR) repeat protein